MGAWRSRLSHLAFVLLTLFTLGMTGFGSFQAFKLVNQPFPGFCYLDIGQGYLFVNALNQHSWSGYQEGLMLTDTIHTVDGQPVQDHTHLKTMLQSHKPGDVLHYELLSQGKPKDLYIPVMHFTWIDFWLVFGLCLAATLALLSTSLAVYILRTKAQGTWAFVLFSQVMAIYSITGFEASFNHSTTFFFWLSSALLPVTVLQLTLQFPRENLLCQKFKWLLPASYVLAALIGVQPSLPLLSSQPHFLYYMLLLFLAMSGLSGSFFFGSMIRLYRSRELADHQQATVVKQRVKLLLTGAVVAFVLPALLAVVSVIFPRWSIPFNYLALLLVIFPISASFAIIQYNLFNVDAFLKKLLVLFFSVDTTLLLYVLFYVYFEQMGLQKFRASPAFSLGFALLIMVLFSPLHTLLSNAMERLFNRGKQDFFKASGRLNQQLATLLSRQEILDLLAHVLIEDLSVEKVMLWQAGEDTIFCYEQGKPDQVCDVASATLLRQQAGNLQNLKTPLFISEVLESKRYSEELRQQYLPVFETLAAVVFLPLIFQDTLKGLLILSGKSNAEPFAAEELSVLQTLSYQTAIALENARFYETIRELNENLEQKVEERTQALTSAVQEKEKTQAQLIRSESLAAIGQLVAGVAHELNNPLGSAHSLVQSAIEILEEQSELTPDQEDVVDDLKFVLKEQNRAKEIVSSLLDLSRQTTSYAEPVNLNLVIDDAIRIMHNKYKYLNVCVETQLDPNLPLLQGNFSQIGQVCINIIQNAIQSVASQVGKVRIETASEGDTVFFLCQDNGGGIPGDKLRDIFKPFFTTKGVGEGTGLGLYICHEIVTRHQGRIEVSNAPDGGAVFKIVLPLKQGVAVGV